MGDYDNLSLMQKIWTNQNTNSPMKYTFQKKTEQCQTDKEKDSVQKISYSPQQSSAWQPCHIFPGLPLTPLLARAQIQSIGKYVTLHEQSTEFEATFSFCAKNNPPLKFFL